MRKSLRVWVNFPFTLLGSGLTCKGTVGNLGLDGAFLKLANVPGIPLVANLKIHLASMPQPLEVLVRAVRSDSESMEVEFLDLGPHQRALVWDQIIIPGIRNLQDCPYCGKPVEKPGRYCSNCRESLEFHRKDFPKNLLRPEQDEEMIGTCPEMQQVFHLIRKVAPADVAVLITGASGTGKELVARSIHERSQRSNGPFVPINCGAIPRELLESEIFGHEKGAFTGAYRTMIGTAERANGGTLFLDEVGELPPELQVKLLRFLQEYAFTRVGGRIPIKVDLRIISATNSDLKELSHTGRFREDLYYRLDVVHIHLPPLKDRGEDQLIIAHVFLKQYAAKVGKSISGFTKRALAAIRGHYWPGNIRELINRIRRAVVMSEGPWIDQEHLGFDIGELKPEPIHNGRGLKEAKAEFEAKLVAEVLNTYQGNAHLASKALKISRSMLYHLVKKYNLGNFQLPSDTGRKKKGEKPLVEEAKTSGRDRKLLEDEKRHWPGLPTLK
jgi:DNA-binding NtrC family response regulator